MINVIFTTERVPFNDTPDQPSELREQLAQIAQWVSPLPESRIINDRVMVQGFVSGEDSITMIEQTLTSLGLSPVIIGVWDASTGLHHGVTYGAPDEQTGERPKEGTPVYPFNVVEYQTYLADVVSYDVDGNVTSSRRPTEEEARATQVNRYAGMPKRDLT